MKVSILIVSHAKDIEWLRWCLRSIKRFASGFHQVVIAWPVQEQDQLWGKIEPDSGAVVRLFVEADPPLGQLHHQVQKCLADEYCRDADFILHFDSDCVFREPVVPEDFFVDGKPILLYDSWTKSGFGVQWRAPTELALKTSRTFDTMRWMTMVYSRETYALFREHISVYNEIGFTDYVLAQKPTYPQGFSEFNALGNFALSDHPEKYSLWNLSEKPWPKVKYIQFWSHGGLDRVIPEEGQEFRGKTPRQVIESILT